MKSNGSVATIGKLHRRTAPRHWELNVLKQAPERVNLLARDNCAGVTPS